LIAALVAATAFAQTPRTAGGKPDLNGSWNLPFTPNMAKDIGELPFTPEGKAAYAKLKTVYDPTGFCMFPGVPRITNSPFPMRIVQTPDSIVLLVERYRLMDANRIGYDVTVDDAKMYTRPWSNHRVLDRLKPGDHLMEYSCEENNKDRDEGYLRPGPTVVPFNTPTGQPRTK